MYYIIIHNNKKEMQTLRPRHRPTESEPAFHQDLRRFTRTSESLRSSGRECCLRTRWLVPEWRRVQGKLCTLCPPRPSRAGSNATDPSGVFLYIMYIYIFNINYILIHSICYNV